jgi:hypothetical protein
MTLSH